MTRALALTAVVLLAAPGAAAEEPPPPDPPPAPPVETSRPAEAPAPRPTGPEPPAEEPIDPAEVQPPETEAQPLPWGLRRYRYDQLTRTGARLHMVGNVEIEQNDGQRFFADEAHYDEESGLIVATGSVVYSGPDSRIAADRLEFDSKTRTGTFYNAYGSASLGDHVEKSFFGTQEPDAYFYGDEISKIGPRRYRVRRGGFTSCVQPTPRWELVATTATIELDEYAVLTNAVLRAKGIPVFYLPVIYYPIQPDDRATGFLIPVYGASTLRGQSVSNAFFWAIDRSQDATIFHDWFSRAGQGVGGEYRYVAGDRSQGQFSTYLLNGKETEYEDFIQPARRSFEVRANVAQAMPGALTAQANVNYFSDIATQQLYQQNLWDASQRSRTISGRVAGSWGYQSMSASVESTDIFYGDDIYSRYGAAPRLQYRLSNLQLGSSPLFVTLPAEFSGVLRRDVDASRDIDNDRGLNRIDLNPAISMPFPTWSFLTVTNQAALNHTWFSQSLVDTTGDGRLDTQMAEPIVRRYWELGSTVVGPVLNKIWDTPGSRFKHVIEPHVGVVRLTDVDAEISAAIPRVQISHFLVTNTTNVRYGVTNRILRKAAAQPNAPAREILSASVSQTYYTNPEARLSDFRNCPSCFYTSELVNYSPIQLDVNASPTERTSTRFRMEYDTVLGTMPSLSLTGRARVASWLDVDAGWSQRNYRRSRFSTDNFVNVSTSLRQSTGRFGTTHSFFYDLGRSTLVEHRIVAFYNAQCCGIAVEYQTYNYPTFSAAVIPQDRRINISFTLAGIGTFSNLLGAFGGNMGPAGGGYGRSF